MLQEHGALGNLTFYGMSSVSALSSIQGWGHGGKGHQEKWDECVPTSITTLSLLCSFIKVDMMWVISMGCVEEWSGLIEAQDDEKGVRVEWPCLMGEYAGFNSGNAHKQFFHRLQKTVRKACSGE